MREIIHRAPNMLDYLSFKKKKERETLLLVVKSFQVYKTVTEVTLFMCPVLEFKTT